MLKLSAWNFRKFVILSRARSGSTFLQRTLASHPHLICETELLGPPMLLNSYHFQFSVLNSQTLSQYLDEKVWSVEDGKSDIRAKGFRIQYAQWKDWYGEYLRNERIMPIHLIRQNALNVVLSGKLNALQDELLPKAEYSPDLKVEVRPEEVERAVRRAKRFTEMFGELFPDALIVYYEDLCQDLDFWLGSIQDYLNVSRSQLFCNLVKQRVHTQRTHIVNYDALKEHFSGTRHIFMFED